MRTIGLRAPHVNERRLAEAAEAGTAALTDAERRHVTACERCGRLFEGHRRAVHLLSGPWQRVDTRRATFLMWRRGKVARWAQLASAVAIGVALTAALLYWRQSGTPAVSASASPSAIPTAPTVSSSPLPTGTALAKDTPFSTPSSASTLLVCLPRCGQTSRSPSAHRSTLRGWSRTGTGWSWASASRARRPPLPSMREPVHGARSARSAIRRPPFRSQSISRSPDPRLPGRR